VDPAVATDCATESSQQQQILLLVDGDVASAKCPPEGAHKAPIAVTVTVLNCTDPVTGMAEYVPVLDATAEEEACSHAQVHFSVSVCDGVDDDEAVLCAVRTSGNGSLPLSLLPSLSSLALKAAKDARASYQIVGGGNGDQRRQTQHDELLLLQEPFVMQ